MTTHEFSVALNWENPDHSLTSRVSREHIISTPGHTDISGSAAPVFHGSKTAWNPEQLLLSATAQCHMMTFIYLASQAGLNLRSYADEPEATLNVHPDASGEITAITLHPRVVVACPAEATQLTRDTAIKLHSQVPDYCFIQRSIRVPVECIPYVELSIY